MVGMSRRRHICQSQEKQQGGNGRITHQFARNQALFERAQILFVQVQLVLRNGGFYGIGTGGKGIKNRPYRQGIAFRIGLRKGLKGEISLFRPEIVCHWILLYHLVDGQGVVEDLLDIGSGQVFWISR